MPDPRQRTRSRSPGKRWHIVAINIRRRLATQQRSAANRSSRAGLYAGASPGYNGPHGEPLNALGFKVPATQLHGSNDADPDLPNAITVSGGILAIAVDAPNTNPTNTGAPVNSTPNYIRNPVILAGGKIAATGYEVTYNEDPGLGEGIPNSNPVVARFGGNFTVAAGTSQVLTYDPVGGTGAAPSNWSAARGQLPPTAPDSMRMM